MTCSGIHRERLFIGEASFKGVYSLLKKHKNSHPNLNESITATELKTFGRTSDDCPQCLQKYNEQDEETRLALSVHNLFIADGGVRKGIFCSDRCRRIQSLKDRKVTIILGYDGTKIHEHPLTQGRIFPRIQWNCPHDKSNYNAQTLPPIIKSFFQSAAQMQQTGHRVHVTLAQPLGGPPLYNKPEFYQGIVYDIRAAAKSNGYLLYAKRPFGPARYPGYKHEQTGSSASAAGAERQREFVFIKSRHLPAGRIKSKFHKETFDVLGRTEREYYIRNTDDESSDYSSADEGSNA